eukprot:c6065_g1_i1.p1 GENE.c6065_g1_i1~~c6065_g1_i1.p1  ORF type:complete len:190 (-),score=65.60 c6065_g1_i1:18-587(-)
MLVLIIGDFHVPQRATELPDKFRALLGPDKIKHIVCTGNLSNKDTLDYLKTISSEIHLVSGDADEDKSAPETKVVTIEGIKIGVIHGHQLIPWGDPELYSQVQRNLDCDILVTGHTHQLKIYEQNSKLFVNPGSATGAYSATTGEVAPSFVVMAIDPPQKGQPPKASLFSYELIGDDVKVSKSDFTKST